MTLDSCEFPGKPGLVPGKPGQAPRKIGTVLR